MRLGRFLLGLAATAALASTALGQEQWLSYRATSEAQKVVGAGPGQVLEIAADKPAGVALPQLKGGKPLFAKWKTPMVPAGFLWVAMDDENGVYKRLYIDSNADGSLADEKPQAINNQAYDKVQSGDCPQVKVLLPAADGPVTYHLDFELWVSPESQRLLTKSGCLYESTIRIGDKKCACVLYDANANGAFNDANDDFQQSDRIRLEVEGSPFSISRVGKYVQVGEAFYPLTVSADGASVSLSGPPPRFAEVPVSQGVDYVSVGGVNGLYLLRPQGGKLRMPEGVYFLNSWQMQRKDNQGTWLLTATLPAGKVKVQASAGKAALLALGEPLTTSMSVGAPQANGGCQLFDPTISGPLGERISVTLNGQMPPAPTAKVYNADRTYTERLTFAYG